MCCNCFVYFFCFAVWNHALLGLCLVGLCLVESCCTVTFGGPSVLPGSRAIGHSQRRSRHWPGPSCWAVQSRGTTFAAQRVHGGWRTLWSAGWKWYRPPCLVVRSILVKSSRRRQRRQMRASVRNCACMLVCFPRLQLSDTSWASLLLRCVSETHACIHSVWINNIVQTAFTCCTCDSCTCQRNHVLPFHILFNNAIIMCQPRWASLGS